MPYGSKAAYSPLTVDFNSGSNSTLTVFNGFHAGAVDTWVRLDDLRLSAQ
ncbi:hypothetical protein [Deinococcus hohokamensis]|uniref:Uncharacterized protein n=1 Tax=Deinococcus hohokamensis TaxID=309883 RepID=A0ABV9ICT4_9DEIO